MPTVIRWGGMEVKPEQPSRAGWGGGADAYLMAIYVLFREEPPERVVSARVAEYLGVSPVSVSRALTRLLHGGDLERKVPWLKLTASGWLRAEVLLRHHHLAERWLTDELGLNWALAHQEAERIGQAFSPQVAEALWQRLGRPQRCPHGSPIPGTGAANTVAVALSGVDAGTYVVDRVLEQVEGFTELLTRLQSAGLMPGKQVEVARHQPTEEVSVRSARPPGPWTILEPWLARRVLVRAHYGRGDQLALPESVHGTA